MTWTPDKDMQYLLLPRQLLGLETIVQKLSLGVSEHLLCQCGTLKIIASFLVHIAQCFVTAYSNYTFLEPSSVGNGW